MRFTERYWDYGHIYGIAVRRGPFRTGAAAKRSYGRNRVPLKVVAQGKIKLRAWATRTRTGNQWKQLIMRMRRRGEIN